MNASEVAEILPIATPIMVYATILFGIRVAYAITAELQARNRQRPYKARK